MKSYRIPIITSVLSLLLVVSTACTSAPAIATSMPPTISTNTALPTSTFVPSPTPDITATQKADTFASLLNTFVEKGYLDSTAGDITELNPAEADWNQGGWSLNKDLSDFLFSAHYAWDTVKGNPQALGCAIIFALQPVTGSAHYELYFNKTNINLSWVKNPMLYPIGKTSGTGRVDFNNKNEADFAVLVRGLNLYVSVDGGITKYTLSANRPTQGTMYLSRNFVGTCKMSNMMLWTPK